MIHPDPSDCHYYLQCADRRLYRFYCGEEAVFDVHTTTCQSPQTATGAVCGTEMDRQDGVEKESHGDDHPRTEPIRIPHFPG